METYNHRFAGAITIDRLFSKRCIWAFPAELEDPVAKHLRPFRTFRKGKEESDFVLWQQAENTGRLVQRSTLNLKFMKLATGSRWTWSSRTPQLASIFPVSSGVGG